MLKQLSPVLLVLVILGNQVPAAAQQQTRTVEQQSHAVESVRAPSATAQTDQLLGQLWGLQPDEIQRAKILMQGPRASFSTPGLSPIEALGIHARSEGERRKYAEMFAKAFHSDVERSLAWNNAFQQAMATLYPNEPAVDFSGQAKVMAPVGTADMLDVPRTLIIDPAPSARTGKAKH